MVLPFRREAFGLIPTMATQDKAGASREAIEAHYDVGNEFYRLWLGPTLTYSCALWAEGDTLESAQERKLDFHARAAACRGARRILDIGCGWGSMLRRLVDVHAVQEVVGLTLSPAQRSSVVGMPDPRVSVLLESWRDHEATIPYDGIISIGALEHFVQPSFSSADRIRVYRSFFERCRVLLQPDGFLSLQASAYSRGGFTGGAIASIFPESDLPRLTELITAAEGVMEIVSLRNDREDYAKTCAAWLERLRKNRTQALSIVGETVYQRFDRFLESAIKGFRLEVFHLLRMTFKRFDPRP